jgi:RND family efflux transporter MFP subunit
MSTPDITKLRIPRQEAVDTGAPKPPRALLLAAAGLVVLVAGATFFLLPRDPTVEVVLAEATGGGSASAAGITANGYVVARTKASVSAKIPGRLAYLGVAEGSHVEQGDIMARIESADFEARLAAARAAAARTEAELEQARRDLARTRSMHAEALVSPAELENAQTQVGVLESALRAAQAEANVAEVNLENTRVRAPFDGTVLRKDAEVGEYVAPAAAGGGLTRTAIVTMADLATLEVEVDVNEAYIARIRRRQPARITLDAYPDTSFAGSVRQVVPTADRQKATVQVKVSILERDARILPEMGAKVVFAPEGAEPAALAAPRRVLVPPEAVVQGGDGARVWVVEGGVAWLRDVDVGPERDGKLEVRRGLEGGEQVVVSPPADLTDGKRVRVRSS